LKSNRIIIHSILFLYLIILFMGVTSAADNTFDEKIYEGDGYQINNYFIEVSDITIFSEKLMLEITIYQLKPDGSYEELTTSTTITKDKLRITPGGLKIDRSFTCSSLGIKTGSEF